MDEYELQQALEAMAGAAGPSADDSNAEDIEETAQRWTKLFGFGKDEALDRIVQHRNNLSRVQVLDEHWDTVRDVKEPEGFNREAYEFELNLERQKATIANTLPVQDSTSTVTFLLELKGPLGTLEAVRNAAGLDCDPDVVAGRSAETWEPVRLCCIDADAKASILRWASTDGQGYEPTILVNPKSLR